MQEIKHTNIFVAGSGDDVAICIPTDSCINADGEAVLNRGLAHVADNIFHIAYQLGERISEGGNHVYDLGLKRLYIPSGNHMHYHVISFPIKGDWELGMDIETIRQSAKELVELLDSEHINTCYLPPVGCGLNGMSYEEQVKHVFEEIFDDRFIVIRGENKQVTDSTDFIARSRDTLSIGDKVYVLVENDGYYHVTKETLLHQTDDTLTLQMENEVVHFMSNQDRFLYGSEEDCLQAQQYLNTHAFKDFTKLFTFPLLREITCKKLNTSYGNWTVSEKAMLVNMVEDCEDGHYPIILQWTIAELRKFKNWCNTNCIVYNNLDSLGRWEVESDFKEQLNTSEQFVTGEFPSSEISARTIDAIIKTPTIRMMHTHHGSLKGCKELLSKLEDTVN